MDIPKQAVLLRIFIGEDDRCGSKPLHEAIVLKAREMHLAGATVLRMFDKVGVGDAVKAKIKAQQTPPQVVEAVVNGDAEIAVFLANVLVAPGIDLVADLIANEIRRAATLCAHRGAGTSRLDGGPDDTRHTRTRCHAGASRIVAKALL